MWGIFRSCRLSRNGSESLLTDHEFIVNAAAAHVSDIVGVLTPVIKYHGTSNSFPAFRRLPVCHLIWTFFHLVRHLLCYPWILYPTYLSVTERKETEEIVKYSPIYRTQLEEDKTKRERKKERKGNYACGGSCLHDNLLYSVSKMSGFRILSQALTRVPCKDAQFSFNPFS